MKTLVAIAHHGTRNDAHFDKVMQALRAMPSEIKIVVLSNLARDLPTDVDVRIGAPTSNPRSLPFAHRALFREHLTAYDHFIYLEDDTLLTWASYEAFLETQRQLQPNEVAGFLRTETAPDGTVHYPTCHGAFHWRPSSVRTRGGLLWAHYTNPHAACFIASRAQLAKAIDSGGFGTEPREGRFDMLETAATDFYTNCGFETLICLDKLEEASLPHLSNANLGRLGIPAREVRWQIDALRRIHAGELPADQLLQPHSQLPNGAGSKNCRERADPVLASMLDASTKRVLVWGAGDGAFEATLVAPGRQVTVYPVNAVLGECCRQRGLDVMPLNGLVPTFGERYDAIVLRDVLQIVDDAPALLASLREALAPGGRIVVRVPNLHSVSTLKKRWTQRRFGGPWIRERIGATPFTSSSLQQLARAAGFSGIETRAEVPGRFRTANAISLGQLAPVVAPGIHLRAARA